MYPELFRFDLLGQPRPIYSYGSMLVLAAAVGCTTAVLLARRRGIARWDAASVALLAVAGGILGAGLLDAAINWRVISTAGYYPGLVFYGSIVGAAIAVLSFTRRFRLALAPLADIGAIALPLAHSIGRLGCLLGGCCYGSSAGRWPGVIFSAPRAPATELSAGLTPLHPVQIYESLGLVAIAIVTGLLLWRGRLRGRLFLVYLAAYALLRFGTEFLRGDPYRGHVGPLSTSQLFALAALVLVAALWRRSRLPGAVGRLPGAVGRLPGAVGRLPGAVDRSGRG